jgi:hypothetical protein
MGTLWFSDKQEWKFVYLEKLTFQMVKHKTVSNKIYKISFVYLYKEHFWNDRLQFLIITHIEMGYIENPNKTTSTLKILP